VFGSVVDHKAILPIQATVPVPHAGSTLDTRLCTRGGAGS
jgi:hypothetical protein